MATDVHQTNEVWVPESPSQYCSAPAFAPKEGSTDSTAGYIVTVVFDSETGRSSVAILDSETFTDGPVCWIELESAVPYGICSSWSSRVYSYAESKIPEKSRVLTPPSRMLIYRASFR